MDSTESGSRPDGLEGSHQLQGERLLSCSLWMLSDEIAGNLALTVFLEALQVELDNGAVPGSFEEAAREAALAGTDLGSPGSQFAILEETRVGFLKSAGLPQMIPFSVWLALSFDDFASVCSLQTRFGCGRDTIMEMFVLSVRRNENENLAWRPFLRDCPREMLDEALAVSAGKELNDRVSPSRSKTPKAARTV